ncbi:MAG: hypothetical protein KAH20_16000 [Methylococcales bacterium]|nr:hypothetical protein [Methylococcales bacterium]
MRNLTTKTNIYHYLNVIGAVSLIAFPSVLIIAFSMHFMGEFGFKDFFNFKFSYTQPSPERFMELFKSNKSLDFVLPHLTVYLALPLLVPAIVFLGKILFKDKPILSIIGILLTVIGAIFMGGIFGSWLSFVAIGNVSSAQVSESIPAVTALIQSNKLLSMTGVLAGFSLIGFILISIGLAISQAIPRWQAILILVGNVMIIMFMDLDNLMLIGATLWLIGAIPVGLKGILNKES